MADLSNNIKKQGNCRNKKFTIRIIRKFNLMKLPTLPFAPNSWCFADTCQKKT